jgi:hypothetical protein
VRLSYSLIESPHWLNVALTRRLGDATSDLLLSTSIEKVLGADRQIRLAGLAGVTPYDGQYLREIPARFERPHEVRAIDTGEPEFALHSQANDSFRRVPVDRDEQAAGIRCLPLDLIHEAAKLTAPYGFRHPLGFDEVCVGRPREGSVDLLTNDLERTACAQALEVKEAIQKPLKRGALCRTLGRCALLNFLG